MLGYKSSVYSKYTNVDFASSSEKIVIQEMIKIIISWINLLTLSKYEYFTLFQEITVNKDGFKKLEKMKRVYLVNSYGKKDKVAFIIGDNKVYTIDSYGNKDKTILLIENEKIFSVNDYDNKDKAILIIENGKIFSVNAYGNKDKTILVKENEKIFSANSYGNKDKVILIIEHDEVFSANAYGNKDKALFFIEGGCSLSELIAFLSQSGIF